ncbi:ankyrin repeat-containing domain protein, partial [Blyttiomyces helicus]
MALPIPNEIIDEIFELLPVHVAVSLRRKAVLRRHILNGKLRVPIQRALHRLDVAALAFFSGVCPQWRSTSPQWECNAADDLVSSDSDSDSDSEDGLGDSDESDHENHADEAFVGDGDDDFYEDFGEEDEEDTNEADCTRQDPVAAAVSRERWDAVRILVDAGFPTKRAVRIAIEDHANLHDISYLLSIGHDDIATAKAMTKAACANNLPVVRLLYEQGFAIDDESAMVHACAENYSSMLAYLIEIGAPVPRLPVTVSWRFDERPLLIGDLAAAEGNLEVVEVLTNSAIRNVFTSLAMDEAAKWSLKVVRFLHKFRTEGCTTDAMDNAASCGQLDIVRFLHEHCSEGCTTTAMDGAVKGWAGCEPLEGDALPEAFEDTFLFLHANRSEGCTTIAMDTASQMGCLNIVQYLHENRPEGCSTDAMDRAAEAWSRHYRQAREANGDRAALHEERVKRYRDVAVFLSRHRTEGFTETAMVRACCNGCLELFKLLLSVRPDLCYRRALGHAFCAGHTEILRFLYDRGMRFSDIRARYRVEMYPVAPHRRNAVTFLREMHGMHD